MEEFAKFGWEQLSETLKEPFVGVVVYAKYGCECEICKKGEEKLKELAEKQGREYRKLPKVHIAIKPLTVYDKLQHAWYIHTKSRWSAFGGLVAGIHFIIGYNTNTIRSAEEFQKVLEEQLVGKAFKFVSMQPVEYVQAVTQLEPPARLPEQLRKAKENWFISRVIEEDELEMYTTKSLKEIVEEGKKEFEQAVEYAKKEKEFFGEDFSLDNIDLC